LPLYELDAEPSAEDTAILQSLMTVGTQERLEFEQLSRCGVVTTVSKPPRDHRGTHFVEASARRVDTGFYVRLCSSGDGTRTHNLRITVRVPDTGVGEGTLRRYLQLLDLAEELQVGLAAGEVKNTEALPRLAKKFTNPEKQLEVWKSISRFKQDVQPDVLKGPRP
jgi:hypothetical protein